MAGEKIGDLLSKYDLEDYGRELEQRWTHPDPAKRQSIRDLTAELNSRIVERAVEKKTDGLIPVNVSPDEIAELLDGRGSNTAEYDGMNATEVVDFENWLSESDIDPDALKDDLVSHVTLHSYFKDQRGAESPHGQTELTPEEAKADKIGTVRDMHNKYARYLQDRFEPLRNRRLLPEAEPDIFVEFNVSCPACGTRYSAIEYIENQGCTECNEHTRDSPSGDRIEETADTEGSEPTHVQK